MAHAAQCRKMGHRSQTNYYTAWEAWESSGASEPQAGRGDSLGGFVETPAADRWVRTHGRVAKTSSRGSAVLSESPDSCPSLSRLRVTYHTAERTWEAAQ